MSRRFKSILLNHTNFEDNINELIKYGNEIIFDDKKSQNEKILLTESLILRSCGYWEKFVDNVIIEAIFLNPSKFLINVSLPLKTKLDRTLIRAIIFSNSYLDFHHVNQISSYFRENVDDTLNSFTKISTANKNWIDFIYKIRNYISHLSDFSKKKLYNEMKKRKLCNTRFVEPGKILIKKSGEVFHDIINNFVNCSIKMKKIYK